MVNSAELCCACTQVGRCAAHLHLIAVAGLLRARSLRGALCRRRRRPFCGLLLPPLPALRLRLAAPLPGAEVLACELLQARRAEARIAVALACWPVQLQGVRAVEVPLAARGGELVGAAECELGARVLGAREHGVALRQQHCIVKVLGELRILPAPPTHCVASEASLQVQLNFVFVYASDHGEQTGHQCILPKLHACIIAEYARTGCAFPRQLQLPCVAELASPRHPH